MKGIIFIFLILSNITTQDLLAQKKKRVTKRAEIITSDNFGLSRDINPSTLSDLQRKVVEFYKYVESYNYEELTDYQRRTLLENFAEEQWGDRNLVDTETGLDVFKVIDAYIKADKGLEMEEIKLPSKHQKDLEEFEKKAQEEEEKTNKALDIIKSFYKNNPSNAQKLQRLKSMKKIDSKGVERLELLVNNTQPNDYKKLRGAEQSTENIVLAMNIIKETKDYEAFKTAVSFLKPKLTEATIKEMWLKKKQ